MARIIVPEKDGISYGSGTLVDVRGEFGLVVSNWHVVRDAAGPVLVEFPGGFQSAAEVVKTDKDWDLAALSIRRPPVDPVAVTSAAPQPGEWLTIAGYGGGDWRAVGGPCTQYLAPGIDFPHEMVELAAEARQGDSGGPIFNQRGELAGVLFGSGPGYTSGSYGGRVMRFLSAVVPGGVPGSASETAVAAVTQPTNGNTKIGLPPPPQLAALHESKSPVASDIGPETESDGLVPVVQESTVRLLAPPDRREANEQFGPAASSSTAAVDPRAAVVPDRLAAAETTSDLGLIAPVRVESPLPPRIGAGLPAVDVNQAPATQLLAAAWRQIGGTTFVDQTKTVLAIIGSFSLLAFFWRASARYEPHGEED